MKNSLKPLRTLQPFRINKMNTATTALSFMLAFAFIGVAGCSDNSLEESSNIRSPKGLVATAGTRTVTLDWSGVAAANGYTIYWSHNDDVSKNNGAAIESDTTHFEHKGLANKLTYYYVVTSQTNTGESSDSNLAVATPQPAAPAQPTINEIAAGDTRVTLYWENTVGASTYALYWGTKPTVSVENGTRIDDVRPPFVHTNRENAIDYYYVLVAENPYGQSLASAFAKATPQKATPIAPIITALERKTGQIQLDWKDVSDAQTYTLYWNNSGAVSIADIAIDQITSPYVHAPLVNGRYYYRLQAKNGTQVSALSNEVQGTLATPLDPNAWLINQPSINPPDTPSGFKRALHDGRLTLRWEASEGALGYNLYWKSAANDVTKIANIQSPYTHIGLTNGEIYYYRVSAINDGGESTFSTEINGKPQIIVPGVPAGVTALAGDQWIAVRWDEVENASGYTVQYNGEVATNVISPYKITGLQNGTPYDISVSAYNGTQESGPSDPVITVTPRQPPPNAPQNVTAQPQNGQVTVQWDASITQDPADSDETVTEYSVYYNTRSGVNMSNGNLAGSIIPLSPDGRQQFIHTALTNGQKYYYVISAKNASGGESRLSQEVWARPQVPIPDAPSNAWATAGDNRVTIQFTPAKNALSHNLYWTKSLADGRRSGIQVTTNFKPGDVFLDGSNANGNTYYFQISAFNNGGESARTPEIDATPQVPAPQSPPQNVSAQAGSTEVTISWQAVAESTITGYAIYWSTAPEIDPVTSVPILVDSAQQSYTHKALQNGLTYYYQIVAINAGGESSLSETVIANPQIPAPNPPVLALVATAGDGTIKLDWPLVITATSYTLYQHNNGQDPIYQWERINGVVPGHTQQGLNNKQTYYYRLSASNLGGESGLSPVASATPIAPLPNAPANVIVTAGDTQVTLNWNTEFGLTYTLYWNTDPTIDPINGPNILSNVRPAYVHDGLKNNTAYRYQVTASKATNEGKPSAIISATPQPSGVLPTTPIGVQAQGGDKLITVTWQVVANASDYLVEWSNDMGFTVVQGSITVTTNQYIHRGLMEGVTVYYRVTAQNSKGKSSPSGVVSGVPQASVNNPPVFTSLPSDQVSVDGEVIASFSLPATDADSDIIKYSATNLPPDISINIDSGQISGQIGALASANSPYAVIVTADDQTNTPNATATVSFSWVVNVAALLVPVLEIPIVTGKTIDLNWNFVTGQTYNLYRSATPNIDISVSKPIAADLSVGTYTDATAYPGQEVFYVVTTRLNGNESLPSAEVSALIPLLQDNLLGVTPDYLVNVDALTGQVTPLSGLGMSGYDNISALAYDDNSNVLYGLNKETSSYRLVTVDTNTGDTRSIGLLGLTNIFSMFLSFNSANSVLYALSGTGDLYTVNSVTGIASFVKNTGLTVFGGFAFDAQTGNFYTLSRINQETRLILVDSAGGVGSPVGVPIPYTNGSLSYDPLLDTLLLTVSANPNGVYQLNKSDAQLTSIGSYGRPYYPISTFNATSRVLYSIDPFRRLYTINLPKPQYNGTNITNVAAKLASLQAIVFDPALAQLIGIDSSSGEIVTIDPTNSQATSVSNFNQATGETNLVYTGLAMDPAIPTTMYVTTFNKLYSVNTQDWSVTLLNFSGINNITDLAYDLTPNNTVLYGLASNDKLVTLDVATGVVSSPGVVIKVQGAVIGTVIGIGAVPNATTGVYTLYGITRAGELLVIDKTTGLATIQATGLGFLRGKLSYGNNVLYTTQAGKLVTIDPNTSVLQEKNSFAATSIGTITFESVIGADGILYGVDDFSNELFILNKASGIGSVVGPTGYAGNVALTVNPITKILYGATGQSTLMVIDKLSGASVPAQSPMGYRITGMAFTDTGQLYAIDNVNHQLLTVDIATGVASLAQTLLLPNVSNLTFDSVSQKLITLGGATGSRKILSIDPQSGATSNLGEYDGILTNIAYDTANEIFYFRGFSAQKDWMLTSSIGLTGRPQIQDLAMDPITKIVYGIETVMDRLVRIDTNTGVVTGVGDLGLGIENANGLSYDKSTQNLISYDNVLGRFMAVDKTTGAGTPIGLKVNFVTVESMSQEPISGVLYGVNSGGGVPTSLNILEPGNGLSRKISEFFAVGTTTPPLYIRSIVIDASGNMFGTLEEELVSIDPATAIVSARKKMGFGSHKGLAMDTTNILNKTIIGLVIPFNKKPILTVIDAGTGKNSTIGAIAENIRYLATDSVTGQYYAIANTSTTTQLYTVDPLKGNTSYVGDTVINSLRGLTFDSTNTRLLTLSYGNTIQLAQINPSTGAGSILNIPNNPNAGYLAFKGSLLYGLSQNPSGQLVTIDQASGISQNIGNLGTISYESMSYSTANNIFFSSTNGLGGLDSMLYIDPKSGEAYKMLPYTGISFVGGLTRKLAAPVGARTPISGQMELAR